MNCVIGQCPCSCHTCGLFQTLRSAGTSTWGPVLCKLSFCLKLHDLIAHYGSSTEQRCRSKQHAHPSCLSGSCCRTSSCSQDMSPPCPLHRPRPKHPPSGTGSPLQTNQPGQSVPCRVAKLVICADCLLLLAHLARVTDHARQYQARTIL